MAEFTTHQLSKYACKNLIREYVTNLITKEKLEIKYEDYEDDEEMYNNPEYAKCASAVETAEAWMNAIGISPKSKVVFDEYTKQMKGEN